MLERSSTVAPGNCAILRWVLEERHLTGEHQCSNLRPSPTTWVALASGDGSMLLHSEVGDAYHPASKPTSPAPHQERRNR